MSTITTADGTQIYYKDWGEGPVVTLSHGWPLSADAWDGQMLFLAQHGFRTIAHDRRGHGRSSQPSSGNDMNTYADDLAALIEALDLHEITVVAHCTGGGEVARHIGRHGTARVAKAVLISAVPPGLVKSQTNPDGLPMELLETLIRLTQASLPGNRHAANGFDLRPRATRSINGGRRCNARRGCEGSADGRPLASLQSCTTKPLWDWERKSPAITAPAPR